MDDNPNRVGERNGFENEKRHWNKVEKGRESFVVRVSPSVLSMVEISLVGFPLVASRVRADRLSALRGADGPSARFAGMRGQRRNDVPSNLVSVEKAAALQYVAPHLGVRTYNNRNSAGQSILGTTEENDGSQRTVPDPYLSQLDDVMVL